MNKPEIGRRIKLVRKQNNESQRSFGAKIGVSGSAIGQIETGVIGPSVELLVGLSKYYLINIDSLLDESIEDWTPEKGKVIGSGNGSGNGENQIQTSQKKVPQFNEPQGSYSARTTIHNFKDIDNTISNLNAYISLLEQKVKDLEAKLKDKE